MIDYDAAEERVLIFDDLFHQHSKTQGQISHVQVGIDMANVILQMSY